MKKRPIEKIQKKYKGESTDFHQRGNYLGKRKPRYAETEYRDNDRNTLQYASLRQLFRKTQGRGHINIQFAPREKSPENPPPKGTQTKKSAYGTDVPDMIAGHVKVY